MTKTKGEEAAGALLDVIVALTMPWRLGKRLAGRQIDFRCYGLPAWIGLLSIPALILGGQICDHFEVWPFPAPQAGLLATMSDGIISNGWDLSALHLAVYAPVAFVLSAGMGLLVANAMTGPLKLSIMIFKAPIPEDTNFYALGSRSCAALPFFLVGVGFINSALSPLVDAPFFLIAIFFFAVLAWLSVLCYGWFVDACGQPRTRAVAMGTTMAMLGPGAVAVALLMLVLLFQGGRNMIGLGSELPI